MLALAVVRGVLPTSGQDPSFLESVHEQFMQALYDSVRMFRVDDECEVQIVRRLRHEVDLVFFEYFHDGAQLVQYCAYSAADQSHCSTIFDNVYSAELTEFGCQRRNGGLVGDIGTDVDRYGDVTLRRRDQID